MSDIRPFCAVRPNEAFASKIAALPYDVYTRKEAKKEVEKNPLSFLKIDRPETMFPDEMDMYAPEVYQKARTTLEEMIEKGIDGSKIFPTGIPISERFLENFNREEILNEFNLQNNKKTILFFGGRRNGTWKR